MKLKVFNEETLPPQRGSGLRSPRISFSSIGQININKAAVQLLGLKSGDKISISQDEDVPENWYLFKDAERGFLVRGTTDDTCQFNHRQLGIALSTYFGIPPNKTFACIIAGKPTIVKGDKTSYWGLIVPVKR